MKEVVFNGRRIKQDDLALIYERAMTLKGFACFDGCATYPFCNRLGDQAAYDRLVAMKVVSEKVARDILLAQGMTEDDFNVAVKIYCQESRSQGLDLGD